MSEIDRYYYIFGIICDDNKKILLVKSTTDPIKRSKTLMKSTTKNNISYWKSMIGLEYRINIFYEGETDADYAKMLLLDAIDNVKKIDIFDNYVILNERYLKEKRNKQNAIYTCDCGVRYRKISERSHKQSIYHNKFMNDVGE